MRSRLSNCLHHLRLAWRALWGKPDIVISIARTSCTSAAHTVTFEGEWRH